MLHYKPPFSLFNGSQTDKGGQTGIIGTQPLALYLFGKFHWQESNTHKL